MLYEVKRMQALIKQIREHLDMSQTELAERLNVSFATVNRWENGRAVPNKLAQTKLYEICKENAVSVYDIILEKIANAADSILLSKGRVLLYHGSKSGIEGKIEPKSRSQCDFGKGFYMGTDPLHCVCRYRRPEPDRGACGYRMGYVRGIPPRTHGNNKRHFPLREVPQNV